MAIKVDNTNYNGEVLEKILTVATTGNELVEKGLIHVIPGVEKKLGVPRIKTGKMLQKRKEDPQVSDAKGDFNYSEQTLEPHDFMAFTTFNPRSLDRAGGGKRNRLAVVIDRQRRVQLVAKLGERLPAGKLHLHHRLLEGFRKLMLGILCRLAQGKSTRLQFVVSVDDRVEVLKRSQIAGEGVGCERGVHISAHQRRHRGVGSIFQAFCHILR